MLKNILKITAILCLLTIASVSATYQIQDSYDYLFYAKASYCEKEDIQNWNCESCDQHSYMENVQVFECLTKKAQGFTGYNPMRDEIVVSFRGTSNIRNWLSNLNAIKKSYPYCKDCKVHAGFFNIFNAVENQMVAGVKKLRGIYGKDKQIVVTGHSLGGAVAVLAAMNLQFEHSIHISQLYTFGAPRVGNKYFASYVNKQIPQAMRIQHYKDVVPHVPLSVQFFKHSGNEIHYNKASDMFKDCSVQSCDHYLNCQSITNHVNYLGIGTSCEVKQGDVKNLRYSGWEGYENQDEEEEIFDLNMFGEYMDEESTFGGKWDQTDDSEDEDYEWLQQ